MNIHRTGREYVSWDVTLDDVDGVTFSVSFDNGATWHNMSYASGAVKVLVAGPMATNNPGGTIVLGYGNSPVLIRAANASEYVIRDAGFIHVPRT